MTLRVAVTVLVGLLVAGCAAEPDAGPAPVATTSTSEAPSTPPTEPSTEPSEERSTEPTPDPAPEPTEPAADPLPPVTHPLSLPAVMRKPLDAGPIVRGRVVAETDTYVRREVTYTSDGLTISGILLRPKGAGPFPGIVLNHGYIDPSYYVTGQGLAREQDWLARQGFAVLHTDYRGHAGSDSTTRVDMETRLGYTRDAANAVEALAQEPFVDRDRMAMLGRSMGGGVTQDVLVAYPGLVDAAVVYASVSSSFVDNVRHFAEPTRPDEVAAFYQRFGTPEAAPDFYAGLSPRTYFDRITEPVLMLHGTADSTCPPVWATTTDRLMRRAGVDVRLVTYEGEEHAFIPRWQDSIEESVRFLRAQLRSA